MADTGDAELAAVARGLYARVPGEFVAARNARAAELRRAGERELATQVKALPRATAAAWALGVLAREEPGELDALGELGAELRVAQASANPAELRALGRRRRQLTAAVTRTAARLADERGVPLSAAAQEQVEATWQGVVIDPAAERAVRSLLLVRSLAPGDDLAGALAVAGAAADDGARPVPAHRTPSASSRRRTDDVAEPADAAEPADVAEPADIAREIRRAERELRARERAAEQARADLDAAEEELGRVAAEVLRTAARIEELRRELETREDKLAALDDDRAAAQEEHEDAGVRAGAAARAVEEIRTRLTELRD